MISKNDILKIVRGTLKRKQGALDTRMIHPKRDWAIGLLATVFIFIFAAVYACYAFISISRGIDEPVHIERSVVLYEQEKAAEVFDIYRNRVSAFEQLRSDRRTTALPVIEETIVIEETQEEESSGDAELAQ